jgi:crotonobetaine/carnitine-CoA ligase
VVGASAVRQLHGVTDTAHAHPQAAETATIVGGRTPYGILVAGADRHPGRELLVYEHEDGTVTTYTWNDVAAEVLFASARLSAHGVVAGDRVVVHLPNRPEFLFVWFALGRLGASMVPTNLASSPPELAYIAGHSAAMLAVGDHSGWGELAAAAGLQGLAVVDWGAPHERHQSPAVAAVQDPMREHAVIYTSGTTARPKGVRVTAGNYVFAGEVYASALRVLPSDRTLTVLPLFHANAQYYSVMGALVSGATVLLMPRFSASGWPQQVVRHRATLANLFGAPLRMLLARGALEGWSCDHLRAVMFAQSITDAEAERWETLTGVPLIQGYGMTETIGPPLLNSLGEPRRVSAIGRPTLGYRIRLVAEDGGPAGRGEPGELLVAGEPGVSLMAGYLDDPEATAAAMDVGWLRTGDILRLDPDGLYSFVDRRKDMIKRAGENVAASEVEAVLLQHPAVRDAAVFGIPDAIRDEEIVACVALDDAVDPDALMAWCRDRLAAFRVPGRIVVVDEMPRTPVGKIQKHVLRGDVLAAANGDGSAADGAGPLL